MERSSVWSDWVQIAGPVNAAHCYPEAVSRGTLYVFVEDSVWMHRVSFATERMLEAVNERLGGEEVRRIQFRLSS